MKRIFTTNLILLLLLNLLVKPFWIFGIDRTVQNTVGAGEYGLFYSLFNFSLLVNIVLDFGLTNFNNREISRHSQLLSKYFPNITFIKLILAFFYILICVGVGVTMGYNSRYLYLLSILALNQIISSFILYLRSNLSGLQLYKTDSVLSVLDRFIMIIICSFLLWGNIAGFQFSIEWFIYAQTISYLTTSAVALLLVVPKVNPFKFNFDKVFLLSILKQSYPYALLALLMAFYIRIDTVMLERILPNGNIEAGIYAQAFRIVDAANMVPFLFAGLLLPMFSKMIKNREDTQSFVGFAFSLLFIPAFSLALGCIVYRTELMQLLYHQHANESATILGLLMISFLFMAITYIFGTLLTANGNIKQLNIISAVGVLLSILINITLIPYYKSLGAAIANMVAQVIVAIIQIIVVIKTFRFKVKLQNIRGYLLFAPLSVLLVICIKHVISSWLIGFMLSLILVVSLSIIFRIVKIKDLLFLVIKDVD